MVQNGKLPRNSMLSLFPQGGGDGEQETTAAAERILLGLADHIYTKTSLKPISKALFLISRCLLVIQEHPKVSDAKALTGRYETLRGSLGTSAPEDDFRFFDVVRECEAHIPSLLESLREVHRITAGTDRLGLTFDTLLRGKFEGGEGLGTFLTPEEVVQPMVAMLLHAIGDDVVGRLGAGRSPLLFGDTCGGTGRFVYSMYRQLLRRGLPRLVAERSAHLFDQSRMAVDFAKLNFLFDSIRPHFHRVTDSLIAPEVAHLKGRFGLIATNPPFGVGKYHWTRDLAQSFPTALLNEMGLHSSADAADPSELFLYHNLDLLADGGGLAIVLPDGLVHAGRFAVALKLYERLRQIRLSIRALISLPVVTFALGGTVAKTSFLVITKDEGDRPLYVAVAHHVGFVKKGNRRAPDPRGNDVARLADDFRQPTTPHMGRVVGNWRDHDRLVPSLLMYRQHRAGNGAAHQTLGEQAFPVRTYCNIPARAARHFHVSVLDVDETGLIDVLAALRNRPATKGVACQPGDVLVSCINPRIWRVALIPDLPGVWSCSAEFLVLRPKHPTGGPRLALALQHIEAMTAVRALAGGTSSSRQRVPKEHLLNIGVPAVSFPDGSVETYLATRMGWYRARIAEGEAFAKLRDGEVEFALGQPG